MAIKVDPITIEDLVARVDMAEREDLLTSSVVLGEHRSESTAGSINASMYRSILDHVSQRRRRTTA